MLTVEELVPALTSSRITHPYITDLDKLSLYLLHVSLHLIIVCSMSINVLYYLITNDSCSFVEDDDHNTNTGVLEPLQNISITQRVS